MPHYNWYDLTAYEKASILAAQSFPTYQGVGSPIDNGQPGNPGESYVDTDTDALYFCIGVGGPWISAGGTGGQGPASIIAGTECIHAFIQRSMAEDERYSPIASDWTISEQVGSALSIDNGGNFVTSDEGTFSVYMSADLSWTVPFVLDSGFSNPFIFTTVNKPNHGGFNMSIRPLLYASDGIGFEAVEARQGPPIHYVPMDGDPSAGAIINVGSWAVNSASPYPTDQTMNLNLHVYITNQ